MASFFNFNKVVLVGRLTRDVELRHTSSGTPVAELGLAVNNRRRNQQGEWEDEASFINVTVWQRDAEMASERLTKGSPVMIEGRLQQDRWEQDGQKRSKIIVVANQVVFLPTDGGQRGSGGGYNQGGSSYNQGGGSYNQSGGNQGYNQDVQSSPQQNAPADSGYSDDGGSDIPF